MKKIKREALINKLQSGDPWIGYRFKAEEITEKYDYDGFGSIAHDYHRLLDLRYMMTTKVQDRAVAMMIEERIRKFAATKETSRLLVHGNGRRGLGSPISFVGAKLAEAFQATATSSNKIIPLAFFCGLHTDGTDESSAHPSGMLLNLLLQLIQQLEN